MGIKTIEYKFLSRPKLKGIMLPNETIDHAFEFFHMVKASENSDDLSNKMNNHPYFMGMDNFVQMELLDKVEQLKKTKSEKSKLKYTDDIYLQIAQHDLQSITDEADRLDEIISGTYRKIYGR